VSKTRSKRPKDKAKQKKEAKPRPERAGWVNPSRAWTEEAKREAVALLESGDVAIGQLADELGITSRTLRTWKDQYDAEEENTPMTAEERRDVARLRRRIKRLEIENEILKKAATFFAKHRS